MRFLFAANRFWALLVAELAYALIAVLVGSSPIELPGVHGPGTLPIAVLAGLLASISLSLPMYRAWPLDRTLPARPPGILFLGFFGIVMTPAFAVCALSDLAWGGRSGLVFIGVFLWLFAIQLGVAVLVSNRYQGLGPAVYVLLCALLGRIDGRVQPWAWPLAWPSAGAALALGTAAFLVCGTMFAALGTHRRAE